MATGSDTVTLRGGLVVRIAARELLLPRAPGARGRFVRGPARTGDRDGGGADSCAPGRLAGAGRLLREAAV